MVASFRGSYSVTVTPFTQDRSAVDIDALKRFMSWQVDSGVPGVIVLGTTGEYLTLTDDEIWNYYKAISEAVSIPIMLYNNPVTSNVDMSAALVARLTRDFENIRYIKESSQDLARVRDVIEATDGVMNVYAGERQVDSYVLGATGYVNPYGNYLPESYRVWDLFEAGRVEDARTLQRIIDEIDHIIAAGHPTYGHQCYSKALAAAVGHPVGDVREPLTTFAELGDEGRERLASILTLIEKFDATLHAMPPIEPAAATAGA
jgi:4-hydroxy-tetrahydrodipicolinate synthase